jgi:hypothetical protein
VVLKDDALNAPVVAAEHARNFGVGLRYVYSHALKGYAAVIAPERLKGALLPRSEDVRQAGRPRPSTHLHGLDFAEPGRMRRRAMVFAIVLTFDLMAGSMPSDGSWGGPPPALQAVLADAATRSGVDRGNLQVPRMEPAEWPDSGLGCPQPGQLYLQVITPGWLIEVQGGGKIFEYHTDGDDRFVLCAER